MKDARTEIMRINAEDEEVPLVARVNSKRQQIDYARAITLFLIPAVMPRDRCSISTRFS